MTHAAPLARLRQSACTDRASVQRERGRVRRRDIRRCRGSRHVRRLAEPRDRERIAVTGFDGYIQKPTDPETFVGKIERLLPERLARRHAMRELH